MLHIVLDTGETGQALTTREKSKTVLNEDVTQGC